MPIRYQDIYPSAPLLDSAKLSRPSAAQLLTLEYFKAEPATMPTDVYQQHHIMLNLRKQPYRIENWRDGEHRDFYIKQFEIVVTPAGIASGWRWYERSEVLIITLEPERLETFAQSELGVVLTGRQLADLPQFTDPDICQAGMQLRDALASEDVGSDLMFEALARVFLIKLIQRYGNRMDARSSYSQRFTARHHRKVLEYVSAHYGGSVTLDSLASVASLSPAHFSRVFKETIGQTPMQFLAAFRIERSKEALRGPGVPLAEVAISCGFSDQAHFSRVFKRVEGESPSSWRARQVQ